MRTKRNSGFTLVEILIVVVILGILAAIVIPQFSQASSDANRANCQSNLQTLRSQVALYRIQNGDADPDCSSAAGFTTAMVPTYLQQFPLNSLSSTATIGATMAEGAVELTTFGATGWYYNTATDIMHAADSAESYAF